MVMLEKAVTPILSLVPTLIAQHTSGKEIDREALDEPFQTAVTMLRKKATDLLDEQKVPYDKDQVAALTRAAATAEEFRNQLARLIDVPSSQAAKLTLLKDYSEELVPQLEAALDAFRGLFIGCVLERQRQHAKRAEEAIAGLDRISKQIFFISINASVEAARVGDAGRGFQQISTDIRALAQSAQESTRGLANLTEGGQNFS